MVLDLAHDVIAAKNRDALTEQLMQAAHGVWDIYTVYLGDQLGLYQALTEIEPATAGELAAATGTHERYVREWLEQQTVTGVLECENPEAPPAARRFALPTGHAEVLVERDNLNYLAPLAQASSAARAPGRASSSFRAGWRSMPNATSTSLIPAMTGFRCLTPTKPLSGPGGVGGRGPASSRT